MIQLLTENGDKAHTLEQVQVDGGQVWFESPDGTIQLVLPESALERLQGAQIVDVTIVGLV